MREPGLLFRVFRCELSPLQLSDASRAGGGRAPSVHGALPLHVFPLRNALLPLYDVGQRARDVLLPSGDALLHALT